MQTAYAIHNSEGVPIRKIISTTLGNLDEITKEPRSMTVRSWGCDFTWKKQEASLREYIKVLRKRKWRWAQLEPEAAFHTKFRRDMSSTYNWRFEIYYPFSDAI